MPVEFKDYYSVLGVARDASGDDIKKAFRKLARLYHPDVAKDKKTAEQKFKEINEAHEVLSDPAKRKKYDELGADWETGGMAERGGAQRAGTQARWRTRDGKAEQEYHFGGTGFSDFFEQFFGGARGGVDVDDLFRDAASRSSHSSSRQAAMRGQDVEGDILVTLDEALNGSTRSISLQRVDPSSGEVETETFQVRIPPGAQEGRRIRVGGKGGPGHGGGTAGDLFLRVRLAADPDFDVRGTDLYHELELAPWEAVLGGHVFVPTLSGRVRLRIPAGTNSGTQLRVKGQGLPKQPGSIGDRGDLYAVVRVNVPVQVTSQEQELWQKLAEISRFRPREQQSEETNR